MIGGCCCGYTIAAGLVGLVVLLLFLRKKKAAAKTAERVQKLKDQANSWEEQEILEFDPATKIKQADFDDIKARLNNRIINNTLDVPDMSPYGTPVSYINLVADYLTGSFDISRVTDVLSQFKHYKTKIGDINLHFIHMEGSEEKKATPIILLHGWPSTVWEFHKSIPKLIEQGYTVVAPSLPGHGFTDPPSVTGVSPCVMACAYHKLMCRLGYKRYVVHGGDWGAIIGSMLTFIYGPEHVIGLHLTMNHMTFGWRQILQTIVGTVAPSLVYTTQQQQDFIHPVTKFSERLFRKFAYFHIQAVMPDTFGYGMVDSPVGLIGWIGAVYAAVSGKRDLVAMRTIPGYLWKDGVKNFGMDNICANLAIFWAMKNAQAAMRIYYEFYWNDRDIHSSIFIPEVPVAISNFPNEILHITKFVSKSTYSNIKQFNYHKHGGHFSHIDNTEGVVGDLTSFIAELDH